MAIKFLGSDFQINTFFSGSGILGSQYGEQIATLTDGRFAVTYQSDFMGDSHNDDILKAVYLSDGSFPIYGFVNGFAGFQGGGAVAARQNGGFGVSFVSTDHADGSPDSASSNDILYVPVSANGFDGAPLAVGDFNGGTGHDDLIDCATATLSSGRQVVVFERVYTFLADDDIYLNVVSADGLSTEASPSVPIAVQVNSAFQGAPSVAALGNSAVVVYEDDTGTTDTSTNISVSIFNDNNGFVGLPITVADHAGALLAPKIVALDDHRCLILYQDSGTNQTFGKIFDNSTSTLSSEFAVDSPGGSDTFSAPAVAVTSDGGFIVAWTTFQDDIFARRYNSDGMAMGQPLLVSPLTDNSQVTPSVAVSGANVMFAWTDNASRQGDTSPSSVRGRMMTLTTTPDLNDNGVSDMLWRNDNGQLALWDMNKTGAIVSGGGLTFGGSQVMPGANWSIVAESDFNGDGKADLVWRNTAGGTALWTMNGSVITSSSSFMSGGNPVNPDTSWNVAGAGDFNGDGMSDLVWRNSSGQTLLWTMNGSVIAASSQVTFGGVAINPDLSWSVAGVGDFNGDSKSDLVWRDTGGQTRLWTMDGSAITASAQLTSGGAGVNPDPSWSIAGIGDFNADGNADFLWRNNTTGSLVAWLMNGSTIVSSGSVTSAGAQVIPDASWHIVEIGDFNCDARTDILWRNDSGGTAEWLMKGTTILSSVTPTSGGNPVNPDPTWSVQAKPTDFA